MLEEIIGPAASLQANNRRMALLEEVPTGKIEVLRRRVTKDGRKKLKLALLGIVVDKCGICLSQFKEDAEASLLPCQHASVAQTFRIWPELSNPSSSQFPRFMHEQLAAPERVMPDL